MKVLQFTVPVANEFSVVVQEDQLPFFYNYLHRHKEAQITMIIKGSGTLILGNYTQPFQAGDIYFIGANQPHIFKSDQAHFANQGEINTHSIHIFFDHTSVLNCLFSLPELGVIKKFLGKTKFGLQVPESYARHIENDIFQIRTTFGLKRLMLLVDLLQRLAGDVGEWKSLSTGFHHSFKDSEGLRMNDIYQYTMEHYNEDISLSKIASIAFMTPPSFCKYFKKHTRKTYISFLNEIRISEACKKIISSDFDSLATIAYATGFKSPITFNRVFRKIAGMAPSDYLKKFKYKFEETDVLS
ncbi:AraC family transcriptional regulator [Flavitalea flava]